ncbi:hypothetical protein [Bradyrhizobium sp. OAE829]|uniref:hypothetical protein n=1 Tax=Bradyrhizobium sp. OAE829 TaxID=2663807 RepID=UPI0017899984
MSTLMMSAAADNGSPQTSFIARIQSALPEFASDRERYAWIKSEYARRVAHSPKYGKGQLARDLAAAAFNVSIADLRGKSRAHPIGPARMKIACVIQVLTKAGASKIGHLLNRTHGGMHYAFRTYLAGIEDQFVQVHASKSHFSHSWSQALPMKQLPFSEWMRHFTRADSSRV